MQFFALLFAILTLVWYNLLNIGIIILWNERYWLEVRFTDIRVGDILVMKKQHPCGNNRFLVLRSGMDFKIKCMGCEHEVMVKRSKAEKNIKSVERKEQNEL